MKVYRCMHSATCSIFLFACNLTTTRYRWPKIRTRYVSIGLWFPSEVRISKKFKLLVRVHIHVIHVCTCRSILSMFLPSTSSSELARVKWQIISRAYATFREKQTRINRWTVKISSNCKSQNVTTQDSVDNRLRKATLCLIHSGLSHTHHKTTTTYILSIQ